MSGKGGRDAEAVAAVERAMVAVRRSQSRRSLARLAVRRGAKVDIAGFEVLDVIEAAEEAGRPASVTSVAAALGVDQPRASKLVAAAVDRGLVRRYADQADGRRALLKRTASGRALSERVHEFRRSVFAEAMSDWNQADRAAFGRLLTRFAEALPPGTGGG